MLALVIVLVALALPGASAQSAPVVSCGSLAQAALGENVSVLSATHEAFCLVKVLVLPAIHIVRSIWASSQIPASVWHPSASP